jgi:hypothetical protein
VAPLALAEVRVYTFDMKHAEYWRLILGGALLLAGCGKEVGRIDFTEPGSRSVTVSLDAGEEVAFWTDLDVEFRGATRLSYAIVLRQDGKEVARANCDALDVSVEMMSKTITVDDQISTSYEGKMRCEVQVPSSGLTEIEATFEAVPMPIRLTSFDLIIKQ